MRLQNTYAHKGERCSLWRIGKTRFGKNSLKGTRAAPKISQFKDTRAQSAPIDLSHLAGYRTLQRL